MTEKFITATIFVALALSLFLLARVGKASGLANGVAFGIAVLVAVLLLSQFGQQSAANIITGLLLGIFISSLALSLLGLNCYDRRDSQTVKPILVGTKQHDTLYVLIHGFGGGLKTWGDAKPALLPYGDVLQLDYPADALSNSDPVQLAKSMAQCIEEADQGYSQIVLVGHSVGALLARKTYLVGASEKKPWAAKTGRIVLLAGMNRGWDVTGKRPMDMSIGRRLLFWTGSWFGRLTHTGEFILSAEMGAPFVSNLRLEWMRWFRAPQNSTPVIVQLLGDIDDLVSDEDNKDLRAAATKNFYWLRVRGTGHKNIIQFSDLSGKTSTYPGIGPYRRDKFLLAATGNVLCIAKESEEQAFKTDDDVTHVVFVLHGIRDLGEWSASFEKELNKRFKKCFKNMPDKLAIVSLRYGYFSIGSFVFQPNRQKYVRWLMDQYTETLARYPNAKQIEFFAHSNGTYLVASALEQYQSMQVDRVAFAGSVVRRDYPWPNVLGRQVKHVRNYFARDDAVVGLFPRFFELNVLRALHNDVGSAGFNGFDAKTPTLENVRIAGGHSAFQGYVSDISIYLLNGSATTVSTAFQQAKEPIMGRFSRWGILLVWAVLLFAVVFPAVRVAMAAGEYAWIPASLYLAVVFLVLQRL